MKQDLPKYPKYKPSGVEWLGVLPENWDIRQLKYISNSISVGVVVNPSSYVTDHGVPFLLGGNIREFRIDLTDCNFCSTESSDGPLRKSRLDADDIVVVRVGYPGVAAVVPQNLAGANCASMMLVRKHKRFSSQWLAYVFNSQVGRDQIGIVQYGAAQKQFNISHAIKFLFPFPSLSEQTAIVAFLDRETAKIDRLMSVRRRQIEVLQEQRAAVIHHAVTKGLDPTAEMKPSGVEWLGEIPGHWEVKPLKYFVSFSVGWTPPTGQNELYEGECWWCTIADLKAETITRTEKTISNHAVRKSRLILSKKGSLLFSFKLSIGLVSFAGVDMYTNEAIATFSENDVYISRYMFFSFPIYIVENSQTNIYGARLLNQFLIKNAKLACPPRTEQAAIVAHIETETAKIDALAKKYQREVELLEEYRASLISHAVTGKIDVRGLV